MIGVLVNKNDVNALSKQFLDLADLKKKKTIEKMLVKSSKPIIKITKSEAASKVTNNEDFTFTRRGTKYTIKAGTIKKSIGVIYHRKSQVPQISIGYRTKKPYDAWFAHFVDAGTKKRIAKKNKGANRGSIDARNIMPKGEQGLSEAYSIFETEIQKEINKV